MGRRVLAWIVIIALGLIGLYTCAVPGDLPADLDGDGFPGTYTVNGTDPLGVEYSGTVVIAATGSPEIFDVEWIVTGGIQRGTGRLAGSRFEVDWQTVASGGGAGAGVAVYEIQPDGRLVGTKTAFGSTESGSEEIFPDAQEDTSNT